MEPKKLRHLSLKPAYWLLMTSGFFKKKKKTSRGVAFHTWNQFVIAMNSPSRERTKSLNQKKLGFFSEKKYIV